MRRALLIVAIAAGVVAPAAPASAHAGDISSGTSYRIRVTAVTPATAGLTVTAIEGGARLQLTNDTGRTVEILGYAGEPYLEVRADGTYENERSPAAYTNRTLAADTAVPASADPAAPPQWRRVSGDRTARWHDQRTIWDGEGLPPEAEADPAQEHRIRDWTVPLRLGTADLQIQGTLDYLPPPRAWLWWAGAALIAVAATVLGRRAGFAGAVAGAALLAYATLRTLETTAPAVTFAAGLIGLASVFAVRSAFLTTLAGMVVAIFGGLVDTAVLGAPLIPIAGPSWLARVAVMLAIGAGLGMVFTGVRGMRKAAATETKVDA